jgi:hypothetical protein
LLFICEFFGLVALAGLAIGSAVFSGCANGDSTSASVQQQNTLAKPHAKDQGDPYPQSNSFVDWTKPAKSQKKYQYQEPYGLGTP